jgi:fatty acid desaturase
MYLNNVNWKYHIAVMKEGITIFGKIAGTMIAVCALFATLIILFGWVVLPFIFLIIICVYFIWMIGNISITKKKWEEDRKEQ